ncbi:MAG: ArsR family transcriptional regulator [Thermoplasmatota archaeon]
MSGNEGSEENAAEVFRPQCSYHPSLPASYMCQHCGASICSYCQRNTDGLPLCPKCFRKHIDRRMRRRSLLLKIIPAALTIMIIGIVMAVVLWPEPEGEERPGELYLSRDDIIPSINVQDAGPNNSLPVMFILYVKNIGELPTEAGMVEISLMKTGIQWDLHQETVSGISPGGMKKVTVSGFNVREGSWNGRISLWRGDIRDQVISISFTVSGGDIADFHSSDDAHISPVPPSKDRELKDSSLLPLLCVGALIIVVVVTLLIVSGVKGYAKLSSGQLLKHPTRNQVIEYLKEHPGAHFRSISRGVATPPGTLRHHLNYLEREGMVRVGYEGMFKRYFPTGAHLDPDKMEAGNRESILEVVGMYPGISQTDLRSIVSIPKQTLSYHLGKLQGEGRLKKERSGSRTGFFLQPLVEAS